MENYSECPECGDSIFDTEDHCPSCGWVKTKKKNKINLEQQLKNIPMGNFYNADRYDTDNEMVLHLWDKKDENSFDIRIPKHA